MAQGIKRSPKDPGSRKEEMRVVLRVLLLEAGHILWPISLKMQSRVWNLRLSIFINIKP